MTNDDGNAFHTPAMLLAGGATGYLLGRWLVTRGRDEPPPTSGTTASSPISSLVPGHGPPAAEPTASAPAATPSTRPGAARVPRRFDSMFEKYRGSIPLEYLRALAMRESGLNPAARSSAGRGLLQITDVARLSYNQANRTNYTQAQLFDPEINVAIGAWLLRYIVDSYQRNHPDVPNLRVDWSNPHFIGLLTAGWNAGYSETGGVGLVARWLKQRSKEVNLDTIYAHAPAAGAVRFLAEPKRHAWWKSVVELYQAERVTKSERNQPGTPCQLRLTPEGLTADGVPVALTAAIARSALRGSELLATTEAPAAVWYELITGLTGTEPRRNARKKPRRAPRDPKPTHGIDLVRFCDTIAAIADKVDVETTPDGLVRGRFGPHKVFLAAVRRGLSRTQYRHMTRAQVDAFLVEGMRQGLLQLARADVPAALEAAEVRDSEIRISNASYHFVISKRDERESSDE